MRLFVLYSIIIYLFNENCSNIYENKLQQQFFYGYKKQQKSLTFVQRMDMDTHTHTHSWRH